MSIVSRFRSFFQSDYAVDTVDSARRTFRDWPAQGRPLLTWQFFKALHVGKDKKILDFGSGPWARMARLQRRNGYDIRAWDFSFKTNSPLVIPHADKAEHAGRYDYVVASNVINTLPTWPGLHETLEDIEHFMVPDGRALVNYPASPRHLQLSNGRMREALETHLEVLEETEAQGSVIWLARKRSPA
jgi:hypothetical protein